MRKPLDAPCFQGSCLVHFKGLRDRESLKAQGSQRKMNSTPCGTSLIAADAPRFVSSGPYGQRGCVESRPRSANKIKQEVHPSVVAFLRVHPETYFYGPLWRRSGGKIS
jgi:hypothetical protein